MKRRFLALGLAALLIVCLLTPAGAETALSYTDQETIPHPEAVTFLTKLGLLSGFPDGTFRPNETVTRAQMAKLTASLLLSAKTPAPETASGVFWDVDSLNAGLAHWAAPYIYWCYEKGIAHGSALVTGNQMTAFRPDDPVTACEAAKMLLIALGYRADLEELTGSGWDRNTNQLAKAAGLYEGYSQDYSEPLTRDGTCLLIVGALNATPIASYEQDASGATMRVPASQTLLAIYFPDAAGSGKK